MVQPRARCPLIVLLIVTLVGGASALCLVAELCAASETALSTTANACHETADRHEDAAESWLEARGAHDDCCGHLENRAEAKIERRPSDIQHRESRATADAPVAGGLAVRTPQRLGKTPPAASVRSTAFTLQVALLL